MIDKAVAQAINTRTRTAINLGVRDGMQNHTAYILDELGLNADHIQHVLSQVIENKYRKQITMTDVENALSKLTDEIEALTDRLVDSQNETCLRDNVVKQGFVNSTDIDVSELEKAATDIIGDLDVRLFDEFDERVDDAVELNLDGRTFRLA